MMKGCHNSLERYNNPECIYIEKHIMLQKCIKQILIVLRLKLTNYQL